MHGIVKTALFKQCDNALCTFIDKKMKRAHDFRPLTFFKATRVFLIQKHAGSVTQFYE